VSTPTRQRVLLCRQRRAAVQLRLYCFPHSGGSPGEYLRWADRLPECVEVWGAQSPGRGSRLAEPPLTDLRAMADEVARTIEQLGHLPVPYAFFGHSMGAAVAYETAVALRARALPGPVKLMVSANGGPVRHRPGLSAESIAAPDFVDRAEELYGPLPPVLSGDPALREAYLRTLRADLTAVATYRHTPTAPLDCPITVFGGAEDRSTAEGDGEEWLATWRHHTSRGCDVHVVSGGHFFFRDRPQAFTDRLSSELEEYVRRLPRL